MTSLTAEFIAFIERWVTGPLSYRYVDSPEGQERVNRAFDRLFAELMRRRRTVGEKDITSA